MEGQTDEETVEVFLVIDERGAPCWQNLPFKFVEAVSKLSIEDQKENPLQCLQSIAATLCGQDKAREEIPMPSHNEHLESIRDATQFRKEDPSVYYSPMHKLGSGGQAAVYKVQRLTDKKEFAMKLMQYSSKK